MGLAPVQTCPTALRLEANAIGRYDLSDAAACAANWLSGPKPSSVV